MAVVKTINKDPKKQMSNRMTSNAHIFNALNYITRKDKTTPELTYICEPKADSENSHNQLSEEVVEEINNALAIINNRVNSAKRKCN